MSIDDTKRKILAMEYLSMFVTRTDILVPDSDDIGRAVKKPTFDLDTQLRNGNTLLPGDEANASSLLKEDMHINLRWVITSSPVVWDR